MELPCSACRRLTPLVPVQVNEQLASERGSLAQVLRQEFADRLSASEEENRQVRAELAELRAHQRLELEQLTQEKQAELEEMHRRWVQGRAGVLGGALLQTRVALAETAERQAASEGRAVRQQRLLWTPCRGPRSGLGRSRQSTCQVSQGSQATAGAPGGSPEGQLLGPLAWRKPMLCRKGGGSRRFTMRAPHTCGTP